MANFIISEEQIKTVQNALYQVEHLLASLHGLLANDADNLDGAFTIDNSEYLQLITEACGILDNIQAITALNIDEEEKFKNSLLNFVLRVSDCSNERTSKELALLPDIAQLILEHFIQHSYY